MKALQSPAEGFYQSGRGGGSYELQAGSPAQFIVADPALNFSLNGNARAATNDSAGAYT
ncbi:hypothetical protein [Qipengyuania sp.]|uniref:hypothetical protein n=1 Tax=Qipengyuania sp. TaxID=2004515 RepID=UPI0035C86FD6